MNANNECCFGLYFFLSRSAAAAAKKKVRSKGKWNQIKFCYLKRWAHRINKGWFSRNIYTQYKCMHHFAATTTTTIDNGKRKAKKGVQNSIIMAMFK